MPCIHMYINNNDFGQQNNSKIKEYNKIIGAKNVEMIFLSLQPFIPLICKASFNRYLMKLKLIYVYGVEL